MIIILINFKKSKVYWKSHASGSGSEWLEMCILWNTTKLTGEGVL